MKGASRLVYRDCKPGDDDVYRFTAEDGASLAYRDEGAGLPLLCLPGLTRSMADFDYLIPHLPPVRLIRMDYRGRGASDRTGAATYTVDQEGREALALLSHLGVQKAAILGTSRGGLIGMILGAVARDRVLGLCLNDVGPEIARDGLSRKKKQAGAAKNSFMKKCQADAGMTPANAECAAKAKDKKLAGAAKNSFMKKCTTDAAAAN